MGYFLDDVENTETPEETKARERVRMVNWMRSILKERTLRPSARLLWQKFMPPPDIMALLWKN